MWMLECSSSLCMHLCWMVSCLFHCCSHKSRFQGCLVVLAIGMSQMRIGWQTYKALTNGPSLGIGHFIMYQSRHKW